MRVALLAGYNKAPHSIAVAELLARRNIEIAAIFVVSALNLQRIRTTLINEGVPGIARRFNRWRGGAPAEGCGRGVRDLLRSNDIDAPSLSAWAASNGVRFHAVPSANDAAVLAALHEINPNGMIYTGGGILHPDTIHAAGGRVLNAHSGPLPEIRGMNACEWSLLLGVPTMVSIHLMDRGVDTGPVVARYSVAVEAGDSVEALRDRCVVTGVLGLVENAALLASTDIPLEFQSPDASRQCFTIAPALRELLELRLSRL